jgi:hypothetical protein
MLYDLKEHFAIIKASNGEHQPSKLSAHASAAGEVRKATASV